MYSMLLQPPSSSSSSSITPHYAKHYVYGTHLVCDKDTENISHKGKFIFRDMDDQSILSMFLDESLLDEDIDMVAEARQ